MTRARNHRDSFHMRSQFRIGDCIFDVADPRFVGRVDAVLWNSVYRVTFLESGWRGDISVGNARLAEEVS